jgi:Ca-activated chloride channel family protein
MTPDVVFFLTDAEQPQLSASELAEVRRLNRGESVINTIEFGSGTFPGGENFLIRLARQNRGRHVYVDVTKLPQTTQRSSP